MSVSSIGLSQIHSTVRVNRPMATGAQRATPAGAAGATSTDSDADNPFRATMKTDLSNLSAATPVGGDGDHDAS